MSDVAILNFQFPSSRRPQSNSSAASVASPCVGAWVSRLPHFFVAHGPVSSIDETGFRQSHEAVVGYRQCSAGLTHTPVHSPVSMRGAAPDALSV